MLKTVVEGTNWYVSVPRPKSHVHWKSLLFQAFVHTIFYNFLLSVFPYLLFFEWARCDVAMKSTEYWCQISDGKIGTVDGSHFASMLTTEATICYRHYRLSSVVPYTDGTDQTAEFWFSSRFEASLNNCEQADKIVALGYEDPLVKPSLLDWLPPIGGFSMGTVHLQYYYALAAWFVKE